MAKKKQNSRYERKLARRRLLKGLTKSSKTGYKAYKKHG